MTGIWAVCVAIARPYAPQIPGRARHDARVSGTAGLPINLIRYPRRRGPCHARNPGRLREHGSGLGLER